MAFDPEDLICPQCRGPKTKQARRCAKCTGEGHTPEQRDLHAFCGAKKRDGSRCRAFAGQGTDHLGVGVCKYHGGATSAHREHAVALELRRRMATLGTPVENITAPEALMGLLRASAGHVAWLQQEVATLDSLEGHEATVIVQLYDSERKMLLQVSRVLRARFPEMEGLRAEYNAKPKEQQAKAEAEGAKPAPTKPEPATQGKPQAKPAKAPRKAARPRRGAKAPTSEEA